MITALWLVSAISALAYGVLWVLAPISPLRTVVKIMPVAALALIAYLTGPQHGVALLLPAALVLSAVGDGFLAGDPKRWLPLGLASFLVAHLIYVALFWSAGGPSALSEPIRPVLIAVSALGGIGMLTWLWPHLGAMRGAAPRGDLRLGSARSPPIGGRMVDGVGGLLVRRRIARPAARRSPCRGCRRRRRAKSVARCLNPPRGAWWSLGGAG